MKKLVIVTVLEYFCKNNQISNTVKRLLPLLVYMV